MEQGSFNEINGIYKEIDSILDKLDFNGLWKV